MKAIERLAESMRSFLEVTPYQPIVEWVETNIDFSLVPGAAFRRIDFEMYPHTREPISMWEFDGKIRELTVCGIEQHGKTQIEVMGVLYTMVFKAGKILCVYPSDQLAASVNQTKYEPLMKRIPQLARELSRPKSRRPTSYNFTNSAMIFYGAGRKVMSLDCFVRVLDETDQHPKNGLRDSVEDSRKRARSFDESMLCNVCTPTTEDGPVWKAFLYGSRGYWTLRCQGCGELTMRSCDLNNLQFDKKYDEDLRSYRPVADSIRLYCPECGRAHVESEKFAMNRQGKYVHECPDLIDLRPSYQFGALCSLRPSTGWYRIAEQILKSGRASTAGEHAELDNSWKGLPYRQRTVSEEEIKDLRVHEWPAAPDPAKIEFVFAVSDTQDTFSPTGIYAVDCRDNLYLLEYRNIPYLFLTAEDREEADRRRAAENLPPAETVEDAINREYLGIPVAFHVIDEKGHRTREVEAFLKRNRKSVAYCGVERSRDLYRPSQKKPRTYLVNASHFQEELIYHLYDHKNREEAYLYFVPGLPDAVLAEISAVKPDKSSKWGHLRANWTPGEAVHDAFDVLKMAYFGLDLAWRTLPRGRFRVGESPKLLKLRGKLDETPKIERKQSGYFGSMSWKN